jgi:hypothetical protein
LQKEEERGEIGGKVPREGEEVRGRRGDRRGVEGCNRPRINRQHLSIRLFH